MRKYAAIFLDRDGVINENRANYVRSWADMVVFPQALAALAAVRQTPYKIFIVTNQSAVGRGILTRFAAEQINQQLVELIRAENGRIDQAYLCPHAPAARCSCRKPEPGLLLQAAAEHQIDLSRSIMIGDALTDLRAGFNAGINQVALVKTGRGQAQLALPEAAQLPAFAVYSDLKQALSTMLNLSHS